MLNRKQAVPERCFHKGNRLFISTGGRTHSFTANLPPLSRARGQAYSLFPLVRVPAIPCSKKDAIPARTTATGRESRRSCRHPISYFRMRDVSLNKQGADIPVLVYTEGILITCYVKQWIIGLKEGSRLPTISRVMIKSLLQQFTLVNGDAEPPRSAQGTRAGSGGKIRARVP